MNKICLTLIICFCALGVCAQTYYDYPDETYWEENRETYCSPQKQGVLTKLRNAFIGQPTGYTTPVPMSSPYINSYGPSYMRGYYGTNGWRDHNVYNPVYSGAGIHILD